MAGASRGLGAERCCGMAREVRRVGDRGRGRVPEHRPGKATSQHLSSMFSTDPIFRSSAQIIGDANHATTPGVMLGVWTCCLMRRKAQLGLTTTVEDTRVL
jgi:hypothetical protein